MNIKIQEPYWGAWQKFGWAKGIWGVGIAVNEIEKAIVKKEPIIITIHGFKEKYQISPTTVKNYAEKNNTKYLAMFNRELYVVPQTELEKCKNIKLKKGQKKNYF